MKVLRVSDEDYAAIASMIAISYPDMFQRIFIQVKQKRARKTEANPAPDSTDMEYFMAAWKGWPTDVKGKWIPGQGFEKRTVLKGSRQVAMDSFFSILRDGLASSRELYAASVAYLLESPAVKEGFVQNVATFYGPKKATYLEWLDRAKEMIEEQDKAEHDG